jgi:hypothetical protein
VFFSARTLDTNVNRAAALSYFSNPGNFSDPDTRELAEILRGLERTLPSGPHLDRAENRRRHIETLKVLSQTDDKTDRLLHLLDRVEYEEGGDEHMLFRVDSEPGRIYKATFGDNFGCRSNFDRLDLELTGKHFNASGNEDSIYYFRRWVILNALGGFKTRFEGILPPEQPHWLPRVCISQPWLDGGNPNEAAISQAMTNAGFLEISRGAFFLDEARILMTDAAPRNVRILEGRAIPFDAIAEIADEDVVYWIKG